MFKVLNKTKKIIVIILVVFFIVFILSRGKVYDAAEFKYGLTFSQKQATSLGFDWQKIYLEILDGLNVKKIRLPAYWNETEISDGQFDWRDLDWQLEKAGEHQAEIILAIGGRLPRWPECHFPGWSEALSKENREKRILDYISQVVERYKDRAWIKAWQVENEPFLSHFGDCPKLDKSFLDAEIALVRELDSRPIVVTDSGELSVWIPAARRADIFGTTMYLNTFSAHLNRYIRYPIAPGFFRFKKNITRLFAKPKDWVVIELQAEPWGPVPYQNLNQAERDRTMSPEKFKEILAFAGQTGFREFYLWGAEYWFWEREQGRPEMWEMARKLF